MAKHSRPEDPEKQERKKVSRFGRIKLLIVLGVLAYSAVTFANQQSMLAVQMSRQADLEQKEAELQREIEYLRNELNYIGTDEYVEQQARIRLGWLKEDEIRYVEGSDGTLAEPESQASQAPEDDAPQETGVPESQQSPVDDIEQQPEAEQ